jgi:hypothetical protein
MARLTAMAPEKQLQRLPFGQNLLGIEFLAEDWDKDFHLGWFEDESQQNALKNRGHNG